MISRCKRGWALAGAALLLLSAACGQVASLGTPPTEAGGEQAPSSEGLSSPAGGEQAPRTDALSAPGASAPAAASPVRAAGRDIVAVRRGSIAERVPLTGRVAGMEEVSLAFPAAGRVETVGIKPGQAVEVGQVLLEAESKEIVKELNAARARLDSSSLRVDQALAQADAQQREAVRRTGADRARRESAIGEAEAGVRRAMAELERARAGPTLADRQGVESAVAAARAGLERAEAEQARVMAGPSPAEVQKAEQEVASARLALQRAEAEQARVTRGASSAEVQKAEQEVASARLALQRAEAEQGRATRGADPAEVNTAEREILTARIDFERALAELDRLTQGPDPSEVLAAEREVERARNALRTAEGMRATELTARADRATAIASATTTLQAAQERLARIREGARPSDAQLDLARHNLQLARLRVDAAQERLRAIRTGPDQLTVDTADAAVRRAQLALENAEAHLRELQAGPLADPAAVADAGVRTARLGLENAEAHWLRLRAGPLADQVTGADAGVQAARAALASATERAAALNGSSAAAVVEAEDRVAQAQAALQRARADAGMSQESDPIAGGLIVAQREVEQDRARVAALERELAATRLLDPFAGIVAAVLVRPGDPTEPGRPVLVLAMPGDPLIRVEATERDSGRLAVGQRATVQLDGGDGAELSASVVELAEAENGAGRVALLAVSWPTSPPALGAAARVAVIVQEKEGVLLVPQNAIRSAGSRRYVESLQGTSRQTSNIEVGIVAEGNAEVLSGLREGQRVLVRP